MTWSNGGFSGAGFSAPLGFIAPTDSDVSRTLKHRDREIIIDG